LIANRDWTILNVGTMMKKTMWIVFLFFPRRPILPIWNRNKFYCVQVGMPNKQENKHAINCGRVVSSGWWGWTRGRKPTANVVTIFYTSSNNITSSLLGPSVNIKWSNLSFGQRRESDDSDVRLVRPMFVYNIVDTFLHMYVNVYILQVL